MFTKNCRFVFCYLGFHLDSGAWWLSFLTSCSCTPHWDDHCDHFWWCTDTEEISTTQQQKLTFSSWFVANSWHRILHWSFFTTVLPSLTTVLLSNFLPLNHGIEDPSWQLDLKLWSSACWTLLVSASIRRCWIKAGGSGKYYLDMVCGAKRESW